MLRVRQDHFRFSDYRREQVCKGVTIVTDNTNAQAQQQTPRRESDLPIELAEPARRALSEAGYWRLEQLTELSEAEVKQPPGVGPKALDQLRRALGINGLSFTDGKSRNMNDTEKVNE
jgi:hypothetical protein